MLIHKILKESGDWVKGDEEIAREACNYFQSFFTCNKNRINEPILKCIPNMITHEQNLFSESMQTMKELKKSRALYES